MKMLSTLGVVTMSLLLRVTLMWMVGTSTPLRSTSGPVRLS